ncbi:hypothetical protein V3G39_12410 [Dermatophilaceae bacterium Sec6.4]
MDTPTDDHALGPDQSSLAGANAVAAWARSACEMVEQEDVVRPVVIAIDGPACAGKTSLAALTAELLDDAPVVAMDDLYPGWDGLADGVRLVADKVLGPMSHGERAWYERYDWVAQAGAETVIVRRHRYLVVEGVGSSAGPASPYADVRVWVDAPVDVRRERADARTAGTQGGFDGHWQHWADQEAVLFAADGTMEHAHLRIDTA